MGKILHNLKSSVFPLFFVVLSLFTLLYVYYTNPPQYRQNILYIYSYIFTKLTAFNTHKA